MKCNSIVFVVFVSLLQFCNLANADINIDIYDTDTSVLSLANADATIALTHGNVTTTSYIGDTVNLWDGRGSQGHFSPSADFSGATDTFVVHATATIVIETSGWYTFGTSSDDGARLIIGGTTVINDDSRHSVRDFFGQIELSVGEYSLDLVFFEHRGGASIELFASQGQHANFASGDFQLVGDVANGGIEAKTSAPATVPSCDMIFPDAVQNNSNSGDITFEQGAQVFNSPDNILESNNEINDSVNVLLTCDTVNCTHSGSSAESINWNDFPNNSNNVNVGFEQVQLISPGNYNNITLDTRAELQLEPGDYKVSGSFLTNFQSKITIQGSGVVRLFVKSTVYLENENEINIAGNAESILLYSNEDITIDFRAKVNGFVYSKKDILIDNEVEITGAINGKNVQLNYQSKITYSSIEPNFGDFCESISPNSDMLGLYQFEQTDFSTQINDSSGLNNHGTNFGGASIADGKYCRGFDSNGTNQGIETNNAFSSNIDLENDIGVQGSISFWFNSNTDWDEGGYNGRGERTLFDATLGPDTGGSKYFALEILSHGRLRFAFEDSSDRDFKLNEPNGTVRDADTWYYLTTTWDFTNDSFQLYLDGNLLVGQTFNTNGQLSDVGDIIFADNSSEYARNSNGSLPSRTSANGRFDEVRIYEKVLSQAEIQADMNDGADCEAEIIAEWRMDELAWSGTAGEVIDQTGNFNAQAINDANTGQSFPAIVGNPGTCGYGSFDGVNDYVALPNSFENQQGSFTITAWIKPSNLSSGSRIFADDENNTQGYALSLGDPGSGRLRFYSRGVIPISVDTLNSVIPADTWTFVAAVHNSNTKTREIYVNGVAQAITGGGTSNTYTGNWGVDNGIASIGGETDSGETANRFTGNIDEVRMYDGALSQSEIAAIQTETHPCVVYLDHFEIDVIDGQGLTCDADNITIRACADASCTMLNTDATDVQLSINGSFNKTVTVIGSTDTSYNYPTAGVATLSLDQTFECVNGSPSDCDVTFADTGFRFFADTEGTAIPTQLSGKSSNIDYNASRLYVQAIETNPVSGACQAALINTIAIEMAATCEDPVACAGQQVVINNLTTPMAIDTLDKAATLTYSSVDLDFSDDSVNTAEFVFSYPDAGSVQLHARYNIPDEDGNPTGNYMTGTSNAFVVKPFGFYINVVDNAKAQSALPPNNGVFIAAGEEFTTHLTAMQWQDGDDADNNGVPDDGANLSDNFPTLNFGKEVSPETAVINHSLHLPNPAVLGNLTNSSFSDFVLGVATNSAANDNAMTYDEVGIISFAATLDSGSYLGAGDVTGSEPFVGRFIPHHFELSIAGSGDGSLASVCAAINPDMDFAYIGQGTVADENVGVLQYLALPTVTITPQAKSGDHTENYTGDFNKLLLTGISRFQVDDGMGGLIDAPLEDGTQNGRDDTNKVKLTANYFDGELTETGAVITYEYSDEDNFIYTHEPNSEIPLFIADINLRLAMVEDEDEVRANDADGDPDGVGPILEDATVITLEPAGKEIRFGRARLQNSFGPETADLPQPFSVEYMNIDGEFVVNELDTCTAFDAANIELTDGTLDEDDTGVNTATGQLDDELPIGESNAMVLAAPGAGLQGNVNVEYEIYDWLKYDWTWDGVSTKSFVENPKAVATFGLFRGNDRIIYQREVH